MKKSFLVVAVILSGLSILPVFAGEEKETRNKIKTEAKFYGYVQVMPKGKIGIWEVKNKSPKGTSVSINKKIIVDKETEIEEKYGKVKVGAYVKVKGNITGKDFIATEIEVKKSKEENEVKEGN